MWRAKNGDARGSINTRGDVLEKSEKLSQHSEDNFISIQFVQKVFSCEDEGFYIDNLLSRWVYLKLAFSFFVSIV